MLMFSYLNLARKNLIKDEEAELKIEKTNKSFTFDQ